jgi:transcriptional regulator with XRE-family HTH domain
MTYRNDLIRAAVVNKDLDKSAFGKQAGLSPTTVIKLWNGDDNIELATLVKVSEFLEIPLHRLFEPKEEAATV